MCRNLSGFSTILQEICQSAVVTEENLVTAEPFDAVFSEKNVIIAISHKASGVDGASVA